MGKIIRVFRQTALVSARAVSASRRPALGGLRNDCSHSPNRAYENINMSNGQQPFGEASMQAWVLRAPGSQHSNMQAS